MTSLEGCACYVRVQAKPRSARMPMIRQSLPWPTVYRSIGHAARRLLRPEATGALARPVGIIDGAGQPNEPSQASNGCEAPGNRGRLWLNARRDIEFTEYVQARLTWLRRVAYLLCQDWDRADDLTQAAVTRLYIHWGQARSADHIDGYVRGILVREFLGARRSAWARRVVLAGPVPDVAGLAPHPDAAPGVRPALAPPPPTQRT